MKKILKTLLGQSDAELVTLVQNGNRQAFDKLTNRWSKKLFANLFFLLHSKEQAEDIMQDTWLFAYELLRQQHYREQGTFAGWLFKIAHNLARKHREKRSHFVLDENILNKLATLPASLRQRRIPVSLLKKAFCALSTRMKQVVKLHVFQKLTLNETAQKLDLPLGTVAGYYKEAIARMRTYLLAHRGSY